MTSQARETVLALIDANASEIVGFLQSLIALQPRGEHAVQEAVSLRLAGQGAKVENLDYAPMDVPLIAEFAIQSSASVEPRSSVVGTFPGLGMSGRSVILFAHPDAEPLQADHGWAGDPFAGTIVDGRIHGWGIADDLAGVAIAVMATEMLAAAGIVLAGEVIVASTPSKRHARGVAAVMHHGHLADAAIYLHPAESGVGMNEIKAFASGQLEFSVTVSGCPPQTNEPGHTSFAHQAVNPLDKALLLITALKALDDRRGSRVRNELLDAAVGRSTNILISAIDFGSDRALSVVPDHLTFGGAISVPPGEAIAAVQAEVEAALQLCASSDPWLVEHPPQLEWLSGVSGAAVPVDHPLYRSVAASIEAVCGFTPRINPMHTTSDIRNPMVQKQIPCVGIGPYCGDLTQTGKRNEWVDRDDYLRAVKVTVASLIAWCGVAAVGSRA